MRYENKVALITGGGSGIGKQVAKTLSPKAATVVIHEREPPNLNGPHVRSIHLGTASLPLPTRLASQQQRRPLITLANDHFGGLDALFNNAGIFAPKPFLDLNEAEFDRFLYTILKGKFFAVASGAHLMKARGQGGVIVQTGSMWGITQFQRNLREAGYIRLVSLFGSDPE